MSKRSCLGLCDQREIQSNQSECSYPILEYRSDTKADFSWHPDRASAWNLQFVGATPLYCLVDAAEKLHIDLDWNQLGQVFPLRLWAFPFLPDELPHLPGTPQFLGFSGPRVTWVYPFHFQSGLYDGQGCPESVWIVYRMSSMRNQKAFSTLMHTTLTGQLQRNTERPTWSVQKSNCMEMKL